jgi:hypothetical protein
MRLELNNAQSSELLRFVRNNNIAQIAAEGTFTIVQFE